ncbi:MAG TPA: hypothetical protein VG963_08550, partial [Polyangiaceae bacterium]|nr:hypothetical protein [Polyangiaceae bacterium]
LLALARTTFALAAFALLTALWRVPSPHLFLARATARIVRMPFDAVALALREHSVVAAGLVGTLGVILWTAWLSYLAPVCGWDGLWYHDSIVGFSIQNHGFARVSSLPPWHSLINDYARGSEYFNLFPALLWDRRLLELAPSVCAAIALPGLDALFTRYGLKPTLRSGLACTYLLLPALSLQLRSTYIDVQVAVAFLAAAYFSTRPELRARDAVMATLCIGLLCNAKSSGLAMSAIVLGVFGARVLLRYGRHAPVSTALSLAIAFIVVALFGGLTFLRNYLLFKNPMYPLVVESATLGIHWTGPAPGPADHNFRRLIEDLLSPPIPEHEWPDTKTNGYGNGLPFIVLPGALIACALLLLRWLQAVHRGRKPAPELVNVSWWALMTVGMVAVSPNWSWARFNLNVVLGVFVLFAWLLARERSGNWGEGTTAALLFTSFLTLLWSRPAWNVTPARALELWRMSPEQRATVQLVSFTIPQEVAAAREAELGPGDLVMIDWDLDFISTAWNEHFSNRIQLMNPHDASAALVQIDDLHPKWVIVRPDTALGEELTKDRAHWQRVGVVRDDHMAFRRSSQ